MKNNEYRRNGWHCLVLFGAVAALLTGCGSVPTDEATTDDEREALAVGSPICNSTDLVLSAYDRLLNQFDTRALDSFSQNMVEHNPQVADGRAGLANFVAFRKRTTPEAHNQVLRVVSQGDLVALHVHVTTTAAERNQENSGVAIVDIFRVARGKIVEHWDVIQPVPSTTLSGHSMFDGEGVLPENFDAPPRLARRNAAFVTSTYDAVLNQFDTSSIATAFGDVFVQHNPGLPDGRDVLRGFADFRRAQQPEAHNRVVRVIAQGDLVFMQVQVTNTAAERGNDLAGVAIADIFRVAQGKIVEHWDVIEPVPPASTLNTHTLFDGGGHTTNAVE